MIHKAIPTYKRYGKRSEYKSEVLQRIKIDWYVQRQLNAYALNLLDAKTKKILLKLLIAGYKEKVVAHVTGHLSEHELFVYSKAINQFKKLIVGEK